MLKIAYDREALALVMLVKGEKTTPDHEIAAFMDAFRELDGDSVGDERAPATVLVIEGGAPPNAQQRAKLASLWDGARAPLHLFAMVTSSSVHRGVFKVIAWLNPPARRRESVHADFGSAERWVALNRGAPVPALPKLHADVRRAMVSG